MPIYAYRCAACGHARDVLQKLSDAPLTTCPACGAEQFSKQVTAAGFQLKGSGWYVTDFRNNGGGAASAPAPAAAGGSTPAPSPAAPSGGEGGGSSSSSSGSGGAGGAAGSSGSGGASASSCGGGCACH